MKLQNIWIVRVVTRDGIQSILHAFAQEQDALAWRKRAFASDEGMLSPAELLGITSITVERMTIHETPWDMV